MIITSDLAYPIIKKLKKFVDYNINIMNENGIIVASRDRDRLHQIHHGAVEVIKTKREIVIYPENADQYLGAKSGVNLPVEYRDTVIGVIGITGHPDDVWKFGQILKVTVEVMIGQMELNNQLQYQNKIVENWVKNFVHPTQVDMEKLTSDAIHYLNIDFEQEVTIFLVKYEDLNSVSTDLEVNMRYQQIRDDRMKKIRAAIPNIVFSAFIEGSCCLIALHSMKRNSYLSVARLIKDLFPAKKTQMKIGAGNGYKGIAGYRKSYLEANNSLQLLNRFPVTENVAHISEWGIKNLINHVSTDILMSFHDQYLEGGEKLTNEQKHTLEQLIDTNLNMKITAEKLHIHRNTLIYRLDAIAKQTGLDPKSFQDLMILHFLMTIDQLVDK
ncbi:helix-turn-helix domain-containing protein [Bacillus sp. EB106-08-02-XG196]|jgi:carbohydrate diacid regulator|uniref:CdaR family transcriptional regulator n=1 Tax=Bacillus sp. EB106-08-02-XG196 TaxID=2737049 RepID=UPI0015C47525|nr:sugar diacid recognition domain-containing protein [Bacillus sp. EB106-08-02-XG196]NWQ40329.1 helix-turn-helix domain-containing protein [Bacillus sp. EB106-08-02-XG196]